MWPKKPTKWIKGRTLYISVPFTWNLSEVKTELKQRSIFWDFAVLGGPAVKLMPHFFDGMEWVSVGDELPSALQRVNPMATRTTWGCPNNCKFCAVPKIEGQFRELKEWPDLPVLTDNNLLKASDSHFNRVIDRLAAHGWCDFNQGLDARLITEHQAEQIAWIKKPIVRFSLDNDRGKEAWEHAYRLMRKNKVAKSRIRTYVLIGFMSGIKDAWERCEWIESFNVKAYPMWFHALDCLEYNEVSKNQRALGWSKVEQKRIMGYYYQHRGKKPEREPTE